MFIIYNWIRRPPNTACMSCMFEISSAKPSQPNRTFCTPRPAEAGNCRKTCFRILEALFVTFERFRLGSLVYHSFRVCWACVVFLSFCLPFRMFKHFLSIKSCLKDWAVNMRKQEQNKTWGRDIAKIHGKSHRQKNVRKKTRATVATGATSYHLTNLRVDPEQESHKNLTGP